MIKPATVIKYVTIGLGCVICMIGAALIVEGVLVRLNSGFLSDEAVSLLNQINYSSMKLGHVLLALVYGMLVSGMVTVCTGVLGIYGAARKSKRSVRMFIVLVIVLILSHGTMVGFWINVRLRSNQWLKGEMLQLLGNYRGPQDTDEVSVGWNKVFMQARCCGVNSQFSQGAASDFEDHQSIWAKTNANNEVIPATCCQGTDNDDDVANNINSNCTRTPNNFYTKGCYDDLRDVINFNSLYVFCIAGGLFVVKLLAIISSCFLQDDSINRVVPFFKSKG